MLGFEILVTEWSKVCGVTEPTAYLPNRLVGVELVVVLAATI